MLELKNKEFYMDGKPIKNSCGNDGLNNVAKNPAALLSSGVCFFYCFLIGWRSTVFRFSGTVLRGSLR